MAVWCVSVYVGVWVVGGLWGERWRGDEDVGEDRIEVKGETRIEVGRKVW